MKLRRETEWNNGEEELDDLARTTRVWVETNFVAILARPEFILIVSKSKGGHSQGTQP